MSNISLQLPNSIRFLNASGVSDYRTGPFESIANANNTVPVSERLEGLPIVIKQDGIPAGTTVFALYAYQNGTNDTDLKPLTASTDLTDLFANNPYIERQVDVFNIKGEGSLFPKGHTPHPISDQFGTTVSFIFDNAGPRELIESTARSANSGLPAGGFKEVFDGFGIKYALSTSGLGTNPADGVTVSERIALANEGFEQMFHTRANDFPNYTEQEADEYLATTKQNWIDSGLNPKNANWFQGGSTPAFRYAMRKHFNSCCQVIAYPFFNTRPINQYNIARYPLDANNQLGGSNYYNQWVSIFDEAHERKAWIIFYGHVDDRFEWDKKFDDDGNEDVNGEYHWQKVAKLISYIQGKPGYGTDDGIKILPYSEALARFDNTIDVGASREIIQATNNDEEYFRISKSGEVSSKLLDKISIPSVAFGHPDYGLENLRIGKLAKVNKSTGHTQTAIGNRAGDFNQGNFQIAIGKQAGESNEKDRQVAVGVQAGRQNTGESQTAIGYLAGSQNTGNYQTAIGYQAGRDNIEQWQTVVGYEAGYLNIREGQTAVGYLAGRSNQGNRQTAVGRTAGQNNTGDNTAMFGYDAGSGNTKNNVSVFGYWAGLRNTGSNLTAFGSSAGQDNGGNDPNLGFSSNFFGNSAGRDNLGNYITAIGWSAGRGNTGNNGVFLGHEAGRDNIINNRFIVVNNVSTNLLIDADFEHGGIALGSPSATNKLADTRIGANRFTFYLDELNNKLMIRVKYADGVTIKEGEVNLV